MVAFKGFWVSDCPQILHRLVENPIGSFIGDPGVGRYDRVQDRIVLHEGVRVVDQALSHLRNLGAARQEVVLQKFVLERKKVMHEHPFSASQVVHVGYLDENAN